MRSDRDALQEIEAEEAQTLYWKGLRVLDRFRTRANPPVNEPRVLARLASDLASLQCLLPRFAGRVS